MVPRAIVTPLFCFDGADCVVYRSVAEAEGDIEPPEVATAILFAADGSRLRLELGPHTTLPERPRWWRPAWNGPADVLVRAGAEVDRDELARRLTAWLERMGDAPEELDGLPLEALVARAVAPG